MPKEIAAAADGGPVVDAGPYRQKSVGTKKIRFPLLLVITSLQELLPIQSMELFLQRLCLELYLYLSVKTLKHIIFWRKLVHLNLVIP